MFEKLTTPEDIFSFKLGSALSMEQDGLKMLADLEEHAQRPELKQLLREHAAETQQQIANIERSFELLGEKVDDSPSPTTKGLMVEGKTTIKKTDDSVVDAVILAGALETEHYEIAVYETLVTNAEARGASEVAELLRANLAQEEAAKEKIKAFDHRISNEGIAYDASAAAAPTVSAPSTTARASVEATDKTAAPKHLPADDDLGARFKAAEEENQPYVGTETGAAAGDGLAGGADVIPGTSTGVGPIRRG